MFNKRRVYWQAIAFKKKSKYILAFKEKATYFKGER